MAYFNFSKRREFDAIENSCTFEISLSEGGESYYLEFSNKDDIVVSEQPGQTIIALHLPMGLRQQFESASWQSLCKLQGENQCSTLLFLVNNEKRNLRIYYSPTAYQKIYYSVCDRGVRLASRIALLGKPAQPNNDHEFFFLSYQFYPYGETLFSTVREFDKAGTWRVNAHSISHEAAPNAKPAAVPVIAESQAVEYLYGQMIHVLEKQTLGYDKVAVMLGGFDSALIVALLHHMGRSVTAYTFAFDDKRFQQKNTGFIQDLDGVEHRWVKIEANLLAEGIKNYTQYFSIPVTQPQYLIHTKHMAEIVRADGFQICLTGDGCDGAFYGYPTVFKKAKFLKTIGSAPRFLLEWFYTILSSASLEKILGQPQRILRGIVGLVLSENIHHSFLSSRVMDEVSYSHMFPQITVPDLTNMVNDIAKPFLDLEYYEQVYAGKNFVGLNKAKLAACQNIAGLDIRSPYMDSAIASIGKAFPVEYWIGERDDKSAAGSGGKALLSKMALEKKLLPEQVVLQKKMSPVSAPTDAWFRGILQADLRQYMSDLPHSTNISYVDSFFKNKSIEQWYKDKITVDSFSMQIIAILATYSRFFSKDS